MKATEPAGDNNPAGSARLDAALEYARAGWPVSPCAPRGKTPITAHGLKDATTDVAMIRAWWASTADANVAIATGPPGPTVIDVDGPLGKRAWMRFVAGHGWTTPWALTQAGGWHIYYEGHPDVRNRAGWLEKVDVRGVGGYVLAPCSVGESSDYVWECSPDDKPFGRLPDFVLDALTARARARPLQVARPSQLRVARSVGTAYAAAALDDEVDNVRSAPIGQRNDQLVRSAFGLGQLVASGQLDATAVASALFDAALQVGLGGTEAQATITSGLSAGMTSPRGA